MNSSNAQRIYLDFNASTPLAPEVAAAMKQVLVEPFGNPSSDHWAGRPAREAVETARAQVASILACKSQEVVFTSGGSEANNHSLKGVFFANDKANPHIITSQVEHPAILNPCRFLERLGATVTYLPVDGVGMVDPDEVRRAITPRTVLISIMHANNEVGTIQPIADISRIARPSDGLVYMNKLVLENGAEQFTARAHTFSGNKRQGRNDVVLDDAGNGIMAGKIPCKPPIFHKPDEVLPSE